MIFGCWARHARGPPPAHHAGAVNTPRPGPGTAEGRTADLILHVNRHTRAASHPSCSPHNSAVCRARKKSEVTSCHVRSPLCSSAWGPAQTLSAAVGGRCGVGQGAWEDRSARAGTGQGSWKDGTASARGEYRREEGTDPAREGSGGSARLGPVKSTT